MIRKKHLILFLFAVIFSLAATACGGGGGAANEDAEAETETAVESGETPYIAIVSKGFQHQFWQVVNKGANDAAAELGVDITFDGPPAESDIALQVDMLKSALDKNPSAIALAALDTESVTEQLVQCRDAGIPVIGFDSGVPNAPEGSIYVTVSTNNAAAAGIAAEQLYENADFAAKLTAATVDEPIYVAVLSQDATSESVVSRTSGFVDKLAELVGEDDVQVTGHDKYTKAADNGARLIITVSVPATSSAADMKSGAEAMLTTGKYAAIYGSNENAAGGILAASNDGSDFAEGSRYGEVIAIGFDAGKTQRTAVENGWFYGSVTQDPYAIGYMAVKSAVDAINGVPAASPPIVDTGAKWYNSENLSDPSISELVYE
jgi:ribose transport system substrate-binding protein